MRACFMGQNVTALGYGVAILHTPRLPDPEPLKSETASDIAADVTPEKPLPQAVNLPEPA